MSERYRTRKLISEDKADSEAAVKEACLRLLSMRAHSRSELSDRLCGRGFEPKLVDAVLDRFTEVDLIDDAVFASQWVNSRHIASGRGRRALAIELKRKGVDDTVAAEALEQISDDDEHQRAVQLIDTKVRRALTVIDTSDVVAMRKQQQRFVAMLVRRGYRADTAYAVVTQCFTIPSDEPDRFA